MNLEKSSTILDNLYERAPVIPLTDEDRIVILSDLHVGNRKSRDDFVRNSQLFLTVLKEYYHRKGFTLILNGDVEELHRVRLDRIVSRWEDLFGLFELFQNEGRFYKLIGNHDHSLSQQPLGGVNRDILEGLKLDYKGNVIFIFHGHQASPYYGRLNEIIGHLLRYIVHPIGIRNYTMAEDSQRIHKTERRVYAYSRQRKLISIIGHTHRPLFESLSEIDLLNFKIEAQLRRYPTADEAERNRIESSVAKYKNDLEKILEESTETGARNNLYADTILVPSLFNCGCVIAKRGLTALEIEKGSISLVHWFNEQQRNRYFSYRPHQVRQLEDHEIYRMLMKQDQLDYIFARIKLLA